MKQVLTILLTLIGFSVFSQSSKSPIKQDNQRTIDSLINLPPHPDSAFITLNHLNAILLKIRKEWNMESGEPATQALQLVVNAALVEYRKKRTEQLKSKN